MRFRVKKYDMINAIGIGTSFRVTASGVNWNLYCTPTSLTLTEITGGIQLDWSEVCTDEDGFEIWVSIDGAAYVLLDTVLANVVTYQDLTDYAGSTVEYKVRAYKGTAYSDYSTEESITIDAVITNLTVAWAEDHAVLTWDEQTGWDTEIYSSLDNVNWTLVTTVATLTETYTDHCWQGTTVYFRARPKLGAAFGTYCNSINIVTPLVFKYDNNPTAALSFPAGFALPAGKTVRVSWGSFTGGNERYNDYITTGIPIHAYNEADELNQDPFYIKLSGDLNSITLINLSGRALCYGDLSKWYLPGLSSLITLYLFTSAFTGDLSSWAFTLPSTLVDVRIYGNGFTGDLSALLVNTSVSTVMYLNSADAKNEFTAPPRGTIHQCESGTAGLFMIHCNVGTANLDAWFAWFNTYLVTHTPVRNTILRFDGTGMGVPTGGAANANIVGIKAKYVAAGFTATIYINV